MSKEKKKETIRLVLAEMEKNLDDLREEIGSKFVGRWGKLPETSSREVVLGLPTNHRDLEGTSLRPVRAAQHR